MHRFIGACVLGLLMLALVADAQDKGKKGKQPAGPALDSAKLPPGDFVGTLKTTPGTDRTFTLEAEITQAVPTGGGGRAVLGGNPIGQAQNRMVQAQQRLALARTPQQRQQAMNQLVQAQMQMQRAVAQLQLRGNQAGSSYKLNVQKKAIDFQLADKVKVRILNPPERFDDRGNIKKYSAKELAALKGKDKNLPGYESSLDKLIAGQRVVVSLATVGKAKAKDEELDPDKVSTKKMQVKQILILDPDTGDMPGPAGAKP